MTETDSRAALPRKRRLNANGFASRSDSRFIQELLKPGEHLANPFRCAQVGDGVGKGVVVPEAQERGELVLIELLHADAHVMRRGFLICATSPAAMFQTEHRARQSIARERASKAAPSWKAVYCGLDSFLSGPTNGVSRCAAEWRRRRREGRYAQHEQGDSR